MKKSFVAAVLTVIVTLSCQNENVTNCQDTITEIVSLPPLTLSCEVQAQVREEYTLDAYFLSTMLLDELYGDSLRVEIPDEFIESNLKALSAILEFSENANDSLAEFDIHERLANDYYLTTIYLHLSEEENAFDEWATSGTPTSNCDLNNLVEFYGLSYENYKTFNDGTKYITVQANSFLNTPALAKSFQSFDEVLSTDPALYIGDGNSLRTWMENDQQVIEFGYGFGDCPAGCVFRRYWRYSINSLCEVERYSL